MKPYFYIMPYANKISGIYVITCSVNNKSYIGKSVHCIHRIGQHKIQLKENRHHSFHLQRAYNKYGLDSFTFNILEEYPKDILSNMECYWINKLNTSCREYGYNISIPNETGGFIMQKESKIKLQHCRLGTHLSENTKEKLRKLNINNTLTQDQLDNLMKAGKLYRTTNKFREDIIKRKAIVGRKIIVYNCKNKDWKKFDSIVDAAISINSTSGAVCTVIDRLSRSVKGNLVFSESNFNSNIIYKKQKRKNGRKNNVRLDKI